MHIPRGRQRQHHLGFRPAAKSGPCPGSPLTPSGSSVRDHPDKPVAGRSYKETGETIEQELARLRKEVGKREVDLIVEGHGSQLPPIEVKLKAAATDRDLRHLLWLKQQVPNRVTIMVMITARVVAYRCPGGVCVSPDPTE